MLRHDDSIRRPTAIESYYAVLSRVVEKSAISAAYWLLRVDPPFAQKYLGEVQVRLRKEAEAWVDLPHLPEPQINLRSAVMRKAEQLAALVGRKQVPLDDRAFWVGVQVLSLAGFVIRGIRVTQVAALDSEINRLHGYVEAEVLRLTHRPNASIERLAGIVREAYANFMNAASETEIGRGIESLIDESVVAQISAPALVRGSFEIDTPQEQLMARVWSYTRLFAIAAEKLFSIKVFCDCYVPTPPGDIRLLSSSIQERPESPPRTFGSRSVAGRSLQGGIAIETRCILPNDHPTAYSNSNHVQEGEPTRTIAIPVLAQSAPERYGELFVGVLDKEAPPVEEMPGLLTLALALADRLSEEISGKRSEAASFGFPGAVEDFASFRKRVDKELRQCWELNRETRTRFVVVSTQCSIAEGNVRRESVAHLLEKWARFTAIGHSAGEIVYELPAVGRYVFVRHDQVMPELPGSSDSPFDHGHGVVEAFCPDGVNAGMLGMWSVTWRQDTLAAAKEDLGNALGELIQAQVRAAAEAVIDFNDLRTSYAQNNYRKAYAVAKGIVQRYGSVCGIAVNDLTRLALLNGRFAEALDHSVSRKAFAVWDVEAHSNYLFSLLALGQVEPALHELQSCRVCSALRDGSQTHADDPKPFPAFSLADGIVRGLVAESPLVRWQLDQQVTQALQLLAPREIHLRQSVQRAIEEVHEFWRHGRERRTGTLDNLLRDLDEVGLDARGESPNWREVERLRRVVMVLKGMIAHTLASREFDALLKGPEVPETREVPDDLFIEAP